MKGVDFTILVSGGGRKNISLINLIKRKLIKDIILKNNKRIFSCTKNDNLNDINDLEFGDSEVTLEVYNSFNIGDEYCVN